MRDNYILAKNCYIFHCNLYLIEDKLRIIFLLYYFIIFNVSVHWAGLAQWSTQWEYIRYFFHSWPIFFQFQVYIKTGVPRSLVVKCPQVQEKKKKKKKERRQKMKVCKIENIVRIGENAGDQRLLPFPQYFKMPLSQEQE